MVYKVNIAALWRKFCCCAEARITTEAYSECVSFLAFKAAATYYINPLKTYVRLLYLKTQSVPRCKHFSSRL